MAYVITNTDGSLTHTVQSGSVDKNQFSLALIGRNVANYGQYFAQNTIRHLENFASINAPTPGNRLIGQLWFDKGENLIRVWDGSNWKRTGVVVASQSTQGRPAEGEGAGTQFFNLDTGKLEVHNGTAFVEANYPGDVTTAYSNSNENGTPAHFGGRLRTLFLKSDTGQHWPVLALVYVKSGTGDNPGTTTVNGQKETIMALFSDYDFIIANPTETPVGEEIIDYYPELVGPQGILDARTGRTAGRVLKGLNSRQEYEATNTNVFSSIYVNEIGDQSNPVSDMYVDNITINTLSTIGGALAVTGDITAASDVTVSGDINALTSTVRVADLEVSNMANIGSAGNPATLNIFGTVNMDGVNTQSLGTDAQKVETIFGDSIDTQGLTVDGTAQINTAEVTSLTVQNLTTLNEITATGTSTFNGDINLGNETADTLTVDATSVFNGTVSFEDDVVLAAGADMTISNGTLILLGTSTISGAASNVNITNSTNENATHYLSFTEDFNTDQYPLRASSSLKYSPQAGLLEAPSISASQTITFADLSDGATTITQFDTSLTTNSNRVPTSSAVKTYVDAQVTAQDLDFQGDSGSGAIDLDSETLDIAGGTNITTAASGNQVTVNLDATVSGLTSVSAGTGSFTTVTGNGSGLTALDADNISSGTIANARLPGTITADLNGDVTGDVSGNAGTVTINSVSASSTTHYIAMTTQTSGDGEIIADTGIQYNPSQNELTADVFSGVATQARYADLAEIYATDEQYEAGTVVKLGGSAEITQTTAHNDTEVFGVISTNPAYLMNKDAEGLPVAMTGRCPVKVIGKVKKGDRLISSDVPGVAWALADEAYDPRSIIGRALQDKEDGDAGVIEAVIGVK